MSTSYSGAGTLALTPTGDVLPFEYGLTADDAVTITERGGRIEISRPETGLPYFAAPVPLSDSTFLVPRREGTRASIRWSRFYVESASA